MKRQWTTILLLTLVGQLLAAPATDPEAMLAQATPIENQFGRTRESYYLKRITPEQAITRYRDVIRQAPGSWWAARAEHEILGIYYRDEDWEPYVFHAAGFFQRYPGYASLHRGILYALNRLTWKDDVDPALQAAAFAVVLPNLKGQLQVLQGTRSWIQKLPLRPLDRYELARRATEICGNPQGAERFLAPFLRDALAEMPDTQARAEAEAFLEIWPAERPDARGIHTWLLAQDEPMTAQDLQKADRVAREAFEAEQDRVAQLLADGEVEAALAALRKWREKPDWLVEPAWYTLATKALPELGDRDLLRMLDEGFRQVGVGMAADHLIKLHIERDGLQAGELLGYSAEVARRYLLLYHGDRGRGAFWIDRWCGFVERDHEIAEQLPAIALALEVAQEMGLPDLQARYLYQRAQLIWDRDLTQAQADLAAVRSVCPGAPEAPKAAWLLAALRGDLPIVQGLQPRQPDDFRPYPLAGLPVPEAKVPTTGPVLTGQHEVLAEAWTPAGLPAARLLPLSRTATVRSVSIEASDRIQVVLSLLAADGSLLYRTERAWPFWEAMAQDIYWSGSPLRLEFLPVANVAWVRLDFLDRAAPQVAIQRVTVQTVEPGEMPVRLTAGGENVRGYPLMRWRSPWPHSDKALRLTSSGGTLSILYYGRQATLHLSGEGTARWRLGDEQGTVTGQVTPVSLPAQANDGPHQLFLETGEQVGSLAFEALEVNLPEVLPTPALTPEPLAAVAERLRKRELTVVYARRGTAEEAALARRIAEHAHVYLVSDDAGLNDYPGPYLLVGTPLTHRILRQLPARTTLWRQPAYLNNPDGRIGLMGDLAYATGETPAAAMAAAERLLAVLEASPAPERPVTFFEAALFDRIYPWQLHPERPAPDKVTVRLGRRDRRSVQVGVRIQHRLNQLTATCTPLKHESGAELPAPRIRFVAGYEWIPFFASLRLPDLLVEELPTPVEAPAASALWLTIATSPETPAGIYRGTLMITANGKPTQLPVEVHVLPVTLPPSSFCWYSYATVPYWYHAGTDAWRAACKALIHNEAEHGATMVSIRPDLTWQQEPMAVDFEWVDWQLEAADAIYREAGLPPPMYLMAAPRLMHQQCTADEQRTFSRALTQRLKDAGRFERFYLKVGDEPGDIEAWADLARPYREGGLQTTTAHSTYYDLSTATGLMTAWCPNYEHDLESPFLHQRQAAGDPFWWYICTYPSTRITGEPVDTLPFYWLTAKWQLDGGHSYAALSPPPVGPESTGVPFRYDHGLSWRIAFLPDGRLLDSVRREYEAEAIRDAELIRLVREQADELLERVVPHKNRYAREHAVWQETRETLYDLAGAN